MMRDTSDSRTSVRLIVEVFLPSGVFLLRKYHVLLHFLPLKCHITATYGTEGFKGGPDIGLRYNEGHDHDCRRNGGRIKGSKNPAKLISRDTNIPSCTDVENT